MKKSAPLPGTVIGGVFRVIKVIGEGAMGVVLLAHDTALQRNVAIKLIRPELASTGLRDRFLSEARAMARVSHANVVQIYAFGDHEGAPYIAMQLILGQTLEDIRVSAPPLPGGGTAPDRDLVLRILDETCHGVSAIHAANTVHRDLKPTNILLDADMRARVADFGVASNTDEGAPSVIVGTPTYIAPEIVLQSDVSPFLAHRADVYSLACVAFELLVGRPPFEAEGVLPLMTLHVTEPPPKPSSLRPDLPPAFDDVLLRALAKDPEERTASVEAFRRELALARDGESEPVRILVAEDDDDFREALEITLANAFPDAQIECFPDGLKALAAFDEQPHSVAILDIGMPNLDGIELTAILRTRPTARRVPIVVLTAYGGPSEWKRLSALGADGFLVKPVRLPDVVALVRRALKERTSLPPDSNTP